MRARLQPVLDRCADEIAVLAAFDQLQQALDQAVHHGVSEAASR
jgi:hypothetical protein